MVIMLTQNPGAVYPDEAGDNTMEKVIILTGASRGIGRAAALMLAKENIVVMASRDINALIELKKEIGASGGKSEALPCDVAKENEVKKMIEDTIQKFGRIDVLINNAGFGIFKRADKFSLEEVENLFRVNLFGVFLCVKYTAPYMIEKKNGQIINISSVAGLNGFKGGSAYSATKFALNGYSESLREDLKEFGIAVSLVCPGGVNTGFGGAVADGKISRDFLLEPEDVARTIKYLVDESETANAKMIELKPRRRKEFR